MKMLLRKIPAIVAMLISLVSFFWYIQSIFDSISDIWIGSVIVAMFSMSFYLIDAVISFIRAIKQDDAKFNYLLALVMIGSIPMVIIFGGSGKDFYNVIWNVYYLLMFVLEIVSIKRIYDAAKAGK